MANFFDGTPQTDFQGLMAYVRTHTPNQMLADIRSSSVDPNDLPGIGDMVRMFLKDAGTRHAKVLYAEGIRQLEAEPQRKAPDVNLMFARRNLCACCIPDAPVEAFNVIAEDPTIVAADPALGVVVAMGLVQEGHAKQASQIISVLDQIPLEQVLPKLEEAQMSFDVLKGLKVEIRRHLGGKKMCDLVWWYDESDVGQLPNGLVNMDLNELTKSGIPSSVLATIKTAVVLSRSNDRKMWYCGFFDVQDPSPLLDRGIVGLFRADFYNRIGRFGEDGEVTVYGVHHT